jgi:cation transporter-like permease
VPQAASPLPARHGSIRVFFLAVVASLKMARTGGVHAETTDPRYRKMAEAALGYARAEFEDEVKKLRKENAELKAAAAKALRAPAAGGHGPAPAEDDGTRSPLALALTRARALALFLVFLSVTTVILEGYEHTLAQHVSLAFFVPFLIGHGGNAGGMSVGAIISAIAKGRVPTRSHAYRVATRELVCGLGVAVQLAALTAVALPPLGFDRGVCLVVVFSLAAITALSAVVGAVVPLALDAAGFDAATVAPPAVTTLIDALGLVIYLTIAQIVLKVAPAGGGGHRGEL